MPDCRICLETDSSLISPCNCKGSAEFVHRYCLERWRGFDSELKKYTYCDVCNSKYNINLVLFTEFVPDYSKSPLTTFFINPFFVSGTTYFLFLIVCLFSGEKDGIRLKFYLLLLEYLISGSYCGLYINLFGRVRNKHRYLLNIKKGLILPVLHVVVFSAMSRHPVSVALLNHFLLPQYLFLHNSILNSMNQEYVRIIEDAN